MDIKFLKKCRSSIIHPKFVRWKNVKNKQLKDKNRQYHVNLVNALRYRNNDLRSLTRKHDEIKIQLRQSTTWMKYHSIIYSLNRSQGSKTCIIEKCHQNKYDNLLIEKRLRDGIQQNPTKIITNLTNIDLSNDEISVLEVHLKHGVFMRPKEPEMIAIVENVWEQIQNHGILKNDHISKVRAKTALKSFTYNYLDFDVKQFISDSKSIKTLRKLKDKCLILKPDNGQSIVLINREDYNNSLENLFTDTSNITFNCFLECILS